MCRGPLALVLLVAATATPAAEPILPTPPRQAEAWTPPATTIPRFLASATATLCDQGLADPRGCDYRKIRLSIGTVWRGKDQVAETTGWVIPSVEGGGTPRHAVAWSGLVYPVVDDLGAGDLDADVRAFVAAGVAVPEGGIAPRGGFDGFGHNNESSSIDPKSAHAIKVCLLLRLGRADLAELVWASGQARVRAPGAKFDLKSSGVSYLSLARDLAWYHFDRALCAHMRGDDPIALADARFLSAFARAAETKAEAMGFERPVSIDRRVESSPYLDFLGQLPELLADQERRALERAGPPAPPRGEGRESRIAALIRDLDQVHVRQWGQPGGVALSESPIIIGLIAEGDAAVEPLIRAFRTEGRLTRSVQFHRDFGRNRTILRADRAAYTALIGLLDVTQFAPPEAAVDGAMRTRVVVADEIQAYWDKNKAIPLVERCYRTLADDAAGDAAWLEAARLITQPENVRTFSGGGPFTVTETTRPTPVVAPKARGESLRTGHEPSVATLMARRVESMRTDTRGRRGKLIISCQMAAILAQWDPAAGLATLREMMRICRERDVRSDNGRDPADQGLAAWIARFTLDRDRAGDPEAVREYADWIRTTSPQRLDFNALSVLEPLHRKPGDPTLSAAAAWLFGDPQSPWSPTIGHKGAGSTALLSDLITSPLIDVPAFRAMLLSTLDDRTPIGRSEADNSGVTVRLDDGFSMSVSPPRNPRIPPTRDAVEPLRACDFYAWRISMLPGAPAFDPCWPPASRDNALAAVAAFLQRKRP